MKHAPCQLRPPRADAPSPLPPHGNKDRASTEVSKAARVTLSILDLLEQLVVEETSPGRHQLAQKLSVEFGIVDQLTLSGSLWASTLLLISLEDLHHR